MSQQLINFINEIDDYKWEDFKIALLEVLGKALTYTTTDNREELKNCLRKIKLISDIYMLNSEGDSNKSNSKTTEDVLINDDAEDIVYAGRDLTDVLNNEFYEQEEKNIEIKEVPTYRFMPYDNSEYTIPAEDIRGQAIITIPSYNEFKYYLKAILGEDNILYVEKDIFAKEFPYIKAAYIRLIKSAGDYDVIELNEMLDDLIDLQLLQTDTKIVTWENNDYKAASRPKSDELIKLEGRKQSLLDNKNIRFMYDIDESIYHDKSCSLVKEIQLEQIRGSENPPKDKKPCPDCMMDMLIRKGCKDDFKNVGLYKYFFNKGSVDVDVLKEFLKDRNACFRIESVNKLKMTYNEDTWYIETDGRGNFIKLWHNNYKVDRKGRRHISSDEYHEQKTEMAVSVLTAVHYIMDYQYNKMH